MVRLVGRSRGPHSCSPNLKTSKRRQRQIRSTVPLHSVRSILKKFENNGIADEDYTAATKALDAHFKPKMNRVYLMHLLHQCKQKQDESMDSFYMRVKVTMEPLELSKLAVEELIELITLSQLVNNTSNNSLRKKALKDGLSLKNFIDCARSHERADMQSKEIEKSEASAYSVGAHSSHTGCRNDRGRSQSRHRHGNGQKKCVTCNGPYPHKDKKCPMNDKRAKECYLLWRIISPSRTLPSYRQHM